MYDIIVVGGGPAGLTAALYGLRNGKKVIVLEKSVFGGQITNSPKVENIPGFASISGDEFADKYLDQVMDQGAEVRLCKVTKVETDGKKVTAFTEEGDTVEGLTAILATGTKHRLLGLPGEEDLIGNGISFCAVCDGDFYRERTVCMIGGGNSAFVEANLLVDIVDKLVMLQDLDHFTADKKLMDSLFTHDNVETHTGTKVTGYVAEDGEIKGVKYTENGEEKHVECDGVFLAVGLVPDNSAFTELADCDRAGYFVSDESCRTKRGNIFVAGDCRTKTLRQVTTACGDGAVAAIAACDYIRGL